MKTEELRQGMRYIDMGEKNKLKPSDSVTLPPIRVKENGRTVTIEFRFSGYKIVASDVTWAELDNLVIGQENS